MTAPERPAQMPDAVPRKPNPGSDDAVAIGCLCPILDNGHGRTPPYPPDGWWITMGCPLHAPGDVRVRNLDAA